MTSEEIKGRAPIDLSGNAWLKELCLQLALLNEKQDKQAKQQPIMPRR